MKIHVIGAGFVGQATGQGFLGHGHDVTFVEVDEEKVASLAARGLTAVTPAQIFTTDPADISVLTVNTPTHGGKAELKYIAAAVGGGR